MHVSCFPHFWFCFKFIHFSYITYSFEIFHGILFLLVSLNFGFILLFSSDYYFGLFLQLLTSTSS
jgi:hypothetical protein